jgi:hypothetical protein
MGVLTQTMTRLHDEIVSASRSRQTLRGELIRQTEERRSQVSALCNGFASDLAGAHRAWLGRTPLRHSPAARESEAAEQQPIAAHSATAKGRAKLKPQAAHAPKPAVRSRVARVSPSSKRSIKASKRS